MKGKCPLCPNPQWVENPLFIKVLPAVDAYPDMPIFICRACLERHLDAGYIFRKGGDYIYYFGDEPKPKGH